MSQHLLSRTPVPFVDESYLGYCLRTAEVNGFEGWNYMVRPFVGKQIPKLEHPPKEVLMQLTGHDPGQLFGINRFSANILNGHTVSNRYGRTSIKVCPDCIRESGYHHATHALHAVVACVRHKRKLIVACEKCWIGIESYRPALLRCNCGFDLTKSKLDPVSEETMELQKTIFDIVYGTVSVIDNPDSTDKIPHQVFRQTPLDPILSLIETFGTAQYRMHYGLSPSEDAPHDQVVECASQIFSDWPKQFHQFLDGYGNYKLGSDAYRHDEWNGIYERHGDIAYPDKLADFLGEEYVNYLLNIWPMKDEHDRLIDHRSISLISNSAISQFALIKGIQPSTVESLITKGYVQLIRFIRHDPKQYVVVTHDCHKLPHEFPCYNSIKAAKYLGLTTTQFLNLRFSGYFLQNYRSGKPAMVAEPDLDAFRNEIHLRAFTEDHPGDLLTFKEACRLRSKRGAFHLYMLISMLKGRLHVFNQFHFFSDALVSKSAVLALSETFDEIDPECLNLFSYELRCVDQKMIQQIGYESKVLAPVTEYSRLFRL